MPKKTNSKAAANHVDTSAEVQKRGKAIVTKNVAALRKLEVKVPTIFSIALTAAAAWLLREMDIRNRGKNLPHIGLLASRMRVWKDLANPSRWIPRCRIITFSDWRQTDGGHGNIAAIVAFGNLADWMRLAMELGITHEVDGKVVPDMKKFHKMVNSRVRSEGQTEIPMPTEETQREEDCPIITLSVDTDDQYFAVADQVQLKRSGADMLGVDVEIGNQLAEIGLSPKDAEAACRLIYLRAYRGLKGDASKYGSASKGGNIGAERFLGFWRVLCGDAIVEAHKIYEAAVNHRENNAAFDVDNLAAVGKANILAAVALSWLGKNKNPLWATSAVDTEGNDTDYLSYSRVFAIAGIRAMGFVDTSKGAAASDTVATHLVMECSKDKKRIHITEVLAALGEVVAGENPECSWAVFRDSYLASQFDNAKDRPNPEQEPSLRHYGPDSMGWTAAQIALSKKESVLK